MVTDPICICGYHRSDHELIDALWRCPCRNLMTYMHPYNGVFKLSKTFNDEST